MEKIAKYATIIYAIMWFLGFISSYIYYYIFGINIIEYLDFSEIIFLFFDALLQTGTWKSILGTSSVFLFGGLLHYFLPKFIKGIHSFEIIFNPITYIYIPFMLGYQYYLTRSFSIMFETLLITIFLFIFLYFFILKIENKQVYEYLNEISNKQKNKSKYKTISFLAKIAKYLTFKFIFLTIFLFFTVYYIGYNRYSEANKLKEDNVPTFNVSFQYLNNKVESNSTCYYIGGVKNYIFMYDKNSKKTNVFEKNNITNFKIKRSE